MQCTTGGTPKRLPPICPPEWKGLLLQATHNERGETMTTPNTGALLAAGDSLTFDTPAHGKFRFVVTTTRDEWKAARRCFITATDAARLATQTEASWRAVRDEKTGATTGFSGNDATDWGHEREPAIMDYIASVDPTVEPNDRLVVCAADPRFAATPDGIASDGMVTGQAKASKKPVDPANPSRAWADQVQWEMMCCDAVEAYLAVEEHDGNGGIIGTRHAIIPADKARQAELVSIAERFLAGGPAAPLTDDEKIAAAIDTWADLKQQAAELKAKVDAAEAEVRALIGDKPGTWSTPRWTVKQSAPGITKRIDAAALRADWPDIAEKVTKTTTTRGRLNAPIPTADVADAA